jgi:O-antigen/teichoic acid export membrane protein
VGQTFWYGVPTILNRFLGFGLGLLLFGIYKPEITADNTQAYAIIPFLNVLFTYGLETSYFRFANEIDKTKLYNTFSVSIIITTIMGSGLLYFCNGAFANLLNLEPATVKWMALIVGIDTLSVIPLCKLRQEQRPKKFALVNTVSVVVMAIFVWYFLFFCRNAAGRNEKGIYEYFYNPKIGIGYFLIANILGSLAKLIMVYKELLAIKFEFSWELLKKVLKYSYPFIIIGTAGMINEMLSRVIYPYVVSEPKAVQDFELGILGANFKIAVLVTIFIQIFKMAAEPFFFSVAKNDNAQKTYAKVMKYFVIICCCIFLLVTLFLNVFKLLIAWKHPEYGQGIGIVPILALGYVCIGIYYNLSIWYKLTNNTLLGARITVEASLIAIVSNIVLIKLFDWADYVNYPGYFGAAWATFFTYLYLMVRCYIMGQKHYKVPYVWKKLTAFVVISILLFFVQKMLVGVISLFTGHSSDWYYHITGVILFAAFVWFISIIEAKELAKMPMIGKYFKNK